MVNIVHCSLTVISCLLRGETVMAVHVWRKSERKGDCHHSRVSGKIKKEKSEGRRQKKKGGEAAARF